MTDRNEREPDLTRPGQPAELDARFEAFFVAHKDKFLSIAVKRLHNLYDADEALMDAAMRMHRKWGKIETHPNPMAFSHRILSQSITDFIRHRTRRAVREVPVPGTEYSLFAEVVTSDDVYELRNCDRLNRALELLAKRAPLQATCVKLRYLGDLDIREIAAALKITYGAARGNIHKGKRKLQALMNLPEPGEGDS